MNIVPYYVAGRKKPLWRIDYIYWEDNNDEHTEKRDFIFVDNPTIRRLERFKIERHRKEYLVKVITHTLNN